MTPSTRAILVGVALVGACSPAPAPELEAPEVGAEQGVVTGLPIDRLRLPLGDAGLLMEVAVSLPHNYDPSQAYPVLVIPDADPLMGLLQTVSFLWTEEGTAQEAILVGLPFGDSAGAIWANRSYYLLPDSVGVVEYYGAQLPLNTGGGATELALFLAEEVLPAVEARYSVDHARMGLVGFSMGGLFAAWHLVTHPGFFTDYLIIAPPLSAPMIGSDFERSFEQRLGEGFDRPTRVYVSYAEDDLEMVKVGAARWIEAWSGVDDVNLSFRSERFPGLRHDGGAVPALLNGYKFLYGS